MVPDTGILCRSIHQSPIRGYDTCLLAGVSLQPIERGRLDGEEIGKAVVMQVPVTGKQYSVVEQNGICPTSLVVDHGSVFSCRSHGAERGIRRQHRRHDQHRKAGSTSCEGCRVDGRTGSQSNDLVRAAEVSRVEFRSGDMVRLGKVETRFTRNAAGAAA